MKKHFIFSLIGITLSIFSGFGQNNGRVANFSYGNYDSPDFESYSFWVGSNKRSSIDYTYRTKTGDIKHLKLKYAGIDVSDGQKAFKIIFPNGLLLYITLSAEETLMVKSADGSYSKHFKWLYEGPINGVGTWCEPCTQDGKESVKLLKMYYFK
ncbi:hypothetical protein [Runella sp.]|uniref:hypothetical protein n=1 Tax=Runella sp. TaxID=1960881 RepID=UPI003D0EAF44